MVSFHHFIIFCCRIDLQKVNKRVIEGFIKVGAFDSKKVARSQLMAILDTALEEANSIQRGKRQGQTSLFETMTDVEDTELIDRTGFTLPNIPEWPQDQLLKNERELTGFYITAHPLTRHETSIRKFATGSTVTLREVGDGKQVKLCGVVSGIKNITTKKGDRMAYVQLEDLQGTVEIIVFPELYQNSQECLKPDSVIQVMGTVDHMDNGSRLKATKIESLMDLQGKTVSTHYTQSE